MSMRRWWSIAFVLAACGSSRTSELDGAMSDASVSDSAVPDSSVPDSAVPDSIAAALDGLRWEMPCMGDVNEWNCSASDPAPVVATLQGDAGTTYRVTLRFRGVVEVKTYDGGASVGHFNTGGTPASDGFNVYELQVSEPAQSYFLNVGTSGVGNSFAIDHSATLTIAAGATVTLIASAIDGVQHKNLDDVGHPIVVPGVPPAPDAYDGQFVQMDVVSVDVTDDDGGVADAGGCPSACADACHSPACESQCAVYPQDVDCVDYCNTYAATCSPTCAANYTTCAGGCGGDGGCLDGCMLTQMNCNFDCTTQTTICPTLCPYVQSECTSCTADIAACESACCADAGI